MRWALVCRRRPPFRGGRGARAAEWGGGRAVLGRGPPGRPSAPPAARGTAGEWGGGAKRGASGSRGLHARAPLIYTASGGIVHGL